MLSKEELMALHLGTRTFKRRFGWTGGGNLGWTGEVPVDMSEVDGFPRTSPPIGRTPLAIQRRAKPLARCEVSIPCRFASTFETWKKKNELSKVTTSLPGEVSFYIL